jgi:acid phosphatase (class A)
MLRLSWIGIVLVVGCAAPYSPPAAPTPTSLLDVDSIDAVHLIPGPPAVGSQEYQADFETLKHLQKTRTKAECARAGEEVDSSLMISYFAAPRGPLTPLEVETVKPLFNRILAEGRPVWSKVKKHYARPRPYVTEPKLHPCIEGENTFAYPSGHSAGGRLFGDLLADLYPGREKAIRARGEEIGFDRLIGGVHHPSDVRDARIIADAVYEALKKNPYFVREFSALKERRP